MKFVFCVGFRGQKNHIFAVPLGVSHVQGFFHKALPVKVSNAARCDVHQCRHMPLEVLRKLVGIWGMQAFTYLLMFQVESFPM